MFIPHPLFPGARVALIAPAGPITPERLDAAVDTVKKLELDPVVFDSCLASHGFFAGTDALRAHDVNLAFADRSVCGILCARGGYGTQRILPLLNISMIRKNPKYFSGYSDITALHIALQQRCGLVTYHTPMPAPEPWTRLDAFTLESLRRALFSCPRGNYDNPPEQPRKCIVPGTASGPLTGGNLTVIAASLGTPYEIDTRGKLLFLEEIGEEPYRLDRLLLQLKLAGKFRDCSGVLLGYCTECVPSRPEASLTIPEILEEILVSEKKPVLAGIACGHSLPSLSLPFGIHFCMDAASGRLFAPGTPSRC